MSTGQIFSKLYNKKVMSLAQIKDSFMDVLKQYMKDAVSRAYDRPGSFRAAIGITASTTPNAIDIGSTAPTSWATDGQGGVIKLSNPVASLQTIKLPPVAQAFDVGLQVVEVEDGVEVNPRTGKYEYAQIKESLGTLGNPSAASFDAGTGIITLQLDTLFESGYNHAGRNVRIWLVPVTEGGIGPQSNDYSVAFEDQVVQYDGTHNYVTLSVGRLGQSNVATVSTTLANYRVWAPGPTVVRHAVTDLSTASGVLYLGTVTGTAGTGAIDPGNINVTGQPVVAITMSDLSKVLRIGTNGGIKIKVKADALDSGEPQIQVVNSSGADVFSVKEDGLNGQYLNNQSVVRPKLEPVGQQISSGSSAWQNATDTMTDVTNLSVTLTTSGRPVYLTLISESGNSNAEISADVMPGSTGFAYFQLVRDGTVTIPLGRISFSAPSSGTCAVRIPPSALSVLDPVAAGTYTWKVQAAGPVTGGIAKVFYCRLAAWEL